MRKYFLFLLLFTSFAFGQNYPYRSNPVPATNQGYDLGQPLFYWDTTFSKYVKLDTLLARGTHVYVKDTLLLAVPLPQMSVYGLVDSIAAHLPRTEATVLLGAKRDTNSTSGRLQDSLNVKISYSDTTSSVAMRWQFGGYYARGDTALVLLSKTRAGQLYQPLENQRLSTTNSPTFVNVNHGGASTFNSTDVGLALQAGQNALEFSGTNGWIARFDNSGAVTISSTINGFTLKNGSAVDTVEFGGKYYARGDTSSVLASKSFTSNEYIRKGTLGTMSMGDSALWLAKIALKIPYTDTTSSLAMRWQLAGYYQRGDTSSVLASKNFSDNKYQVKGSYATTSDTTILHNEIAGKIFYSDTSGLGGNTIAKQWWVTNGFYARGDTASVLVSKNFLTNQGYTTGAGYVTTGRTLTINGTTQDLSANRTWSVGTLVGNDTLSLSNRIDGKQPLGTYIIPSDTTLLHNEIAGKQPLGTYIIPSDTTILHNEIAGKQPAGTYLVPSDTNQLRTDVNNRIKYSDTTSTVANQWRLGAYQPKLTTGTTAQYFKGDLSLGTLNQAAVAGLTTSDSPTFGGLTLNGALSMGTNAISSVGAITASGLLAVTVSSGDAAHFMNGNVGVGTTSPKSPLSVGVQASSGLNLGTVADFLGSADSPYMVTIHRANTVNSQNLAFGVNQASLYSSIQAVQDGIAANSLSLNPLGGNVGIGTTGPNYLLDVNGTFHATGAASFASTVSASGQTADSSVTGLGGHFRGLKVDQNASIGGSVTGGSFNIGGNSLVTKLNAGSNVTLSANYGEITISAATTGTSGTAGGWTRNSPNTYLATPSDIVFVRSANGDTTSARKFNVYGTIWSSDTILASGGNSTQWNTAYSQTRQWDGGSTGLVAATGRTSLGLGSLATLGSVNNSNWSGTALADGNIASASTWNTASTRAGLLVADSTNWNSAYTDRLKWDGGSSGLTAATGRTSLGLNNGALLDTVEFAGKFLKNADSTTIKNTLLNQANTWSQPQTFSNASGVYFKSSDGAAYYTQLITDPLSANHQISFQDRGGYVAMLTDIPTIGSMAKADSTTYHGSAGLTTYSGGTFGSMAHVDSTKYHGSASINTVGTLTSLGIAGQLAMGNFGGSIGIIMKPSRVTGKPWYSILTQLDNGTTSLSADSSGNLYTLGTINSHTLRSMSDVDSTTYHGSASINTTGKITTDAGITTAGLGHPIITDVQSYSAQTGTIGGFSFLSTASAGIYRVSGAVSTTTVGSAGTVTINIYWTDDSGVGNILSAGSRNLNITGATPLTVIVVRSSGASAVQWSATVAGASGSPQYRVDMVCERLN